ncbi:sigma 54-interacting transcriptional regulator [Pseudovibrio denitrificans]|uniref:sigma 54-interacting transcriptional regulator n=1 Tax=Pseudovibrio denitrificans TaxID=258256 RepID=UPI0039BF96AE
MDTSSTTDALMAFIACRSENELRAKVLKTILASTKAQAIAVYLPDVTGRKLVPFACDGGLPVSRLPELENEVGTERDGVLDALQTEPFHEAKTQGLSKALFCRHGSLIGHRLLLESAERNNAHQQVYVFLLMPSVSITTLQKDHAAMHVLWHSYFHLSLLLNSLDTLQKDGETQAVQSKVQKGQVDAMLSESLVGRSPQIVQVREKIAQFAQTKYAILVQGETGSGKEIVARSLHRLSQFADGPFIAENISALPANLIESELFGYKKGAFTGAMENRDGLVKRASGGTLFLDEIGDLSMDLQVKLLRILQEKKLRPLGSDKDEPVDFRLVCATHVNLREAIEQGKFRADLFYRISQLAIEVPPLRMRDGDSVHLARYFLQEIAVSEGDTPKTLSSDAMSLLEAAELKGNVRELQNCMIKAVFLAFGTDEITGTMLRQAMDEQITCAPTVQSNDAAPQGETEELMLAEKGLRTVLSDFEHRLLSNAYSRFDGDRRKMADFLQIPKRTLANKLSSFKLSNGGV